MNKVLLTPLNVNESDQELQQTLVERKDFIIRKRYDAGVGNMNGKS